MAVPAYAGIEPAILLSKPGHDGYVRVSASRKPHMPSEAL